MQITFLTKSFQTWKLHCIAPLVSGREAKYKMISKKAVPWCYFALLRITEEQMLCISSAPEVTRIAPQTCVSPLLTQFQQV